MLVVRSWEKQPTPRVQEGIDRARRIDMSLDQEEEQRRSFASGNTSLANRTITRSTVNQAAKDLERASEAETLSRDGDALPQPHATDAASLAYLEGSGNGGIISILQLRRVPN